MNILMVFHAPPCPPQIGPGRRHFHELQQFVARGHQVSVLSYGTPGDEAAFAARFAGQCARVRFVPLHRSAASKACRRMWDLARGLSDFARLRTQAMQRALDEMVAADRFDVAWFSTTMLGALRLPRGIPLVGDTHNIEFDSLRCAFEQSPHGPLRAYFGLQSALTRREEIAHTRKFDVVCATSERDRAVLRAAVPDARIEVAPNGVDLGEHAVRANAGARGTIVFTGLMSYYPNTHGIRWFLDDILPGIQSRIPHARLVIVGAEPPPDVLRAAGRGVLVTGYVADVKPYLAHAQVCVIPLRIGGGTRVKALQAMAMGVPVVSTTLGVEGLDVRDREHVLLGDDPQGFAGAVARLLEAPAIGGHLARRAAAHVRQFDWTRIGDQLERIAASAAGPAADATWPHVAHQA